MRTRTLTLGLAVILANCVRPSPLSTPREDDLSIVFPRFFENSPSEVGAEGAAYELDGVTLRAIMIAANDFLPPGREKRPCWERQEAHRYRVIRQGNIIFVRIDEDLEACGLQYISLDTGATYAISTDGHILRRGLDNDPVSSPDPRAVALGLSADSGVHPPVDAIWGVPLNFLTPKPRDGGSAPFTSDGGTSGTP